MKRQTSPFARKLPAALLAALCCALWGSTSPVLKAGFGWMSLSASDYPGQLLFAGLRFLLAGAMVLALSIPLRRKAPWPRRADWKPVCIIALFQTVLQYGFYYIGLATAGSVTASIVGGVNTFTSILVAALIFRQEALTAPKVVGCALGLAGVALVNLRGPDVTFRPMGEGLILLSSLAYATSTCLMKRFGRDADPMLLSGWQFLLGGAALALAGLASGGAAIFASGVPWGVLTYLAGVSAVAYTLWSFLLRAQDVSFVAMFGFVNPLFGVTLSAILFADERALLDARMLAALLLVCAGIYAVNRRRPGA